MFFLKGLVVWLVAVQSAIARPNFVVLFVDDMGINQVRIDRSRYGDSLYGYTGDDGTIDTPNVDRLAAEGLVFQTWYSSFHVCSPSRSSMMTGRLPVRTGVGVPCGDAPRCLGSGETLVFTSEAIGGLPLSETTTAEALREVGYTTMMFGKWHLGQREKYLPSRRGFDHYLGIPFSQDMGASAWTPFRNEPFQAVPLPLLNKTNVVEQPCDLGSVVKKYAAAAKEFIATAHAPFYLYASFNHVHFPSSAGPEFCGKSKQGAVGDAVVETDWAIGEIMDAIRTRDANEGADAETLVIFTSDNGALLSQDPNGNKPFRGGKRTVWEGGFREPGIVWGRGVKPGLTQAIASTMDIHVTLLKQGGAAIPQERVMDGIDLTPVLAGMTGLGHECYAFYGIPNSDDPRAGLAAVRCGDFKAYWDTNVGTPGGKHNPPLMFNLMVDPGEHSPVSPDSSDYSKAMANISKWREDHLATVRRVTHQTARGSDRQYAICGAPDTVPLKCSVTPENWQPDSVCSKGICVERQNLQKQCGTEYYGNSKAGTSDNVIGAYNAVNGGNNSNHSGIVARFFRGVHGVSVVDTDDDGTQKTMFAFDQHGAGPTAAPAAAPTAAPTSGPTASPTSSPMPALTGGAIVSAAGDPHLANIYGERFDLMQVGWHTLAHIPRRSAMRRALLHVEAKAERFGAACSDIYFASVSAAGMWAEDAHRGGLVFHSGGNESQHLAKWMKLGPVKLKVVRGRALQGARYLNVFIQGLARTSLAVGGLLGMDSHDRAATPSPGCRKRVGP